MESEIAKAHRKARQREYYRKHRDKILAQSRKFIQDHPEKIKEYHKNAARKRENGTGYYQLRSTKTNSSNTQKTGENGTPKR